MANLTRLSVLIGETDADRSRETADLLRQLGVRHVEQVDALAPLLLALRKQAFDMLICAEQLGGEDGVSVLRAARKVAPATRTVLMRKNDRAGEFVPADIEAIELPFSRLTLQGLLHRTASAQGGLWCEVPELSLSDILQMYHQARRSITVLLSGPISGSIRIEAGEIVHAEANDEQGMPALSRLLEAESGLVRTEPPQAEAPRTIGASFQSVILEAAHRLDERRRDSMGAPSPSSSPRTGSSQPPPPHFGEHALTGERTSVSSGVLRPAMTPIMQALAPNPESFLAPERRARRQTIVAVVSVAASLLFVGAAAFYLKDRIDFSPAGAPSDPPRERGAALEEPAAGAVARARGAAERAVPDRREPPASELEAQPAGGSRPQTHEEPVQAPEPTQPEPSHALRANDAPASRPSSFELHITSKPSRAAVTEAGRTLGKTPLTLYIRSSSVAGAPREFMLHLPGYVSARLSQGASQSSVSSSVVLYPLAATLDTPDAGEPASDLDPARPGAPRSKRNDLGIRLRR